MDAQQYDLLVEALRVLFVVCLPVIVALALAGTLVSALQGVTGLNDSASAYALRLIVLVMVLYFFFSSMSESIVNLARMAFG